jgi:hypothetical protein
MIDSFCSVPRRESSAPQSDLRLFRRSPWVASQKANHGVFILKKHFTAATAAEFLEPDLHLCGPVSSIPMDAIRFITSRHPAGHYRLRRLPNVEGDLTDRGRGAAAPILWGLCPRCMTLYAQSHIDHVASLKFVSQPNHCAFFATGTALLLVARSYAASPRRSQMQQCSTPL